ncbi:hypothetical protein B0H17DRAFT_1216039 [Mycena rosella]|uniref:DNA 3'-5' helicase n=1 Tax=Mycena rosella TaxID=1033263 RepID=A0AAD7CDE9_MYCRO|nr:hypothetical protein B0H17DRAFT_1216039 [Mycena rosella]
MPYLFVAEKKGWRDDFGQPWEGTGEDYSELSPRMARLLLPFPESPLRYKNPEDEAAIKEEENLPSPAHSPSPEPRESRETHISHLTTRQVLLENSYRFYKASGIHYMDTCLWILPRRNIAEEFHHSPTFVRRKWREKSDGTRPDWVYYDSSYSIKALESEVIVVAWILDGEDALCVTATGDSKSAIFSVPMIVPLEVARNPTAYRGYVSPKKPVGIVIVPTKGLSTNIRDSDRSAQVWPAEIAECRWSIICVDPEHLTDKQWEHNTNSPTFRENIAFAGADEGHLIHEWGAEFRPAFHHIGPFLRGRLPPHISNFALTATLQPGAMTKSVCRSLGLQPKMFHLLRRSNERTNIQFLITPPTVSAGPSSQIFCRGRVARNPLTTGRTVILAQSSAYIAAEKYLEASHREPAKHKETEQKSNNYEQREGVDAHDKELFNRVFQQAPSRAPAKQQKLTRKMRADAELQLRKFKYRVYSLERANQNHGFTPVSAYFNNPTITTVLDNFLQISSLEKLTTTIPRWKYHSRHGAPLFALIQDLQREFAATFEAARLERNTKNRLRAKSKRAAAWMEEGDEEDMRSDNEQSEGEDDVPQKLNHDTLTLN